MRNRSDRSLAMSAEHIHFVPQVLLLRCAGYLARIWSTVESSTRDSRSDVVRLRCGSIDALRGDTALQRAHTAQAPPSIWRKQLLPYCVPVSAFVSLFLESQSFVFLNDVDYKVADFFAAVDYFHIEQSADILVTVFLYVFDVLLAEVCTQAVDSFFDLE